MKGCASGELLFRLVCLVLFISSVESLNWTARPTNPTVAIKGHDVALTWLYSLSVEEQTKSQTYFLVKWTKFNPSTSSYEQVANYLKIPNLDPNYSEQAPHIVVDRTTGTNFSSLQINDVVLDDEGIYKVEISVEFPGTVIAADHEVNLTVSVPPEIGYVSSDKDECEGALVTLTCNATGKPTPNITWTTVAGNGTDGVPLPAVDGKYVMSNIQRSSNGTYRCTADNGAGNTVNRTVQVRVRYSPVVNKIVNSSNTVNEGSSSFYVTCEASGDPLPDNYTWKRNGTNEVARNGNMLNFTSINRNDTGLYRCEATNRCGTGTGHQFVDVYFPPDITHISDNQKVIQNENVSLNCTAGGNPPPDITWTRVSNNSVVTFPLTIQKQDQGGYRCTANNSIGSPATKDVFITVLYPPNITHISGNQNKNDGQEVKLNCTADGNPTPNITWAVGNIKKHFGSSYPLTINGKQDAGVYTCTADNGIGSQDSDNVSITVEEYRPIDTELTTPVLTVNLSESFTLTCSSQANPPAKYRFYREQESLFNTTVGNNTAVNTTSVNERIKQVTYSCTPVNKYGDGPTGTITVTVHYSPYATVGGQNITRTIGESAVFSCPVNGNPEPNITWYNGSDASGTVIYRGKVLDFPQTGESDTGFYTCSASNSLGKPVNVTHYLLVELVSPSTTSQTTPKGTAEVVWRITLTILNKDCDNFLKEEFRKRVEKILERLGLKDVEIKIRCGSVIVDLVLRFNQSVSQSDVISVLKTAAEQKQFTNFDVDPSSIKATEESTQEPVCKETFLKNKDCSTIVWKIVVLAIAGVVVIAFVVGIVGWWIHKRRKCRRKDPRIHNSGERLHGNAEDNAYSQVNHGYAGTGPRPNGTEAVALQQRAAADGSDAAAHQQEAAAIPTYAEVDKSKKKKKKEEEKLDYTYAEVDKSKKSKKKPKPGEMIYADLEDINVPRPMPTVSTSPQPLPPIKRPEPYENTQYADITQFLKGEATLPQSDSNQGTELQPQGANKDEGGAEGEDRNTPM